MIVIREWQSNDRGWERTGVCNINPQMTIILGQIHGNSKVGHSRVDLYIQIPAHIQAKIIYMSRYQIHPIFVKKGQSIVIKALY